VLIGRMTTFAISLAVLGASVPAFAQRDGSYPYGSIFQQPTEPTRTNGSLPQTAAPSAASRPNTAAVPSGPNGVTDDCGIGSGVTSGGRRTTTTALNCVAPPPARQQR
jgi:hypothetical protein